MGKAHLKPDDLWTSQSRERGTTTPLFTCELYELEWSCLTLNDPEIPGADLFLISLWQMRKPRIRHIELVAQGHTAKIGTQVCWTSQFAQTQPSHPSTQASVFSGPMSSSQGALERPGLGIGRKSGAGWTASQLGLITGRVV